MVIGNKTFVMGERTFVMGILNVTPDSFSDGGKYNEVELAVKRAEMLIKDGADIIDIGGESTRPNSEDIDGREEIKRVLPIIKAIKERFDIPISIDTYKAKTAEEAILAGADMINDVWGFKKDINMAKVAAQYNVPCILMHNREAVPYNELMKDILMDLIDSINIALEAGVKRENIIVDPGIGFGKNYEENLMVMNNLEKIKNMGFPMLLGTSRKSMIGNALELPVDKRVEGTLATTVIGIMKGCEFVRVHDVLENKRACIMTDKILHSN